MAMSFALAGLKAQGVTILDPGCVAKTYPAFWEDLARLKGGKTSAAPREAPSFIGLTVSPRASVSAVPSGARPRSRAGRAAENVWLDSR